MTGKILKTWMGVTSGSYLGRDDGHPERKYQVFDTLEEAVRGYCSIGVEYFVISLSFHPFEIEAAVRANAAEDKEEEIEELRRQQQTIENRIRDLEE